MKRYEVTDSFSLGIVCITRHYYIEWGCVSPDIDPTLRRWRRWQARGNARRNRLGWAYRTHQAARADITAFIRAENARAQTLRKVM